MSLNKMMRRVAMVAGVGVLFLTNACGTVTVRQSKPIEINVRIDIYEHAEQVAENLAKPLHKATSSITPCALCPSRS